MKKFLALLMALSMVLSLCMVPVASADESTATEEINKTVTPLEASEVIFTDKIEDITENLLYPSSAGFANGGFTIDVREQARSHKNDLKRAGVIKSTDASPQTIKKVYSYDDDGTKSPTLEDAYAEGYDILIIGNGLGDTYSGTNGATGTAIAGSPFKGAYVKSVDSPTGEKDKVLHYTFGTNGDNNSACTGGHYRGIHAHMFAGNTRTFTTVGEKMVYSWDVYIPSDVAGEFANDSYQALGGIDIGGNARLLQDRTISTANGLIHRIFGKETANGSQVQKDITLPTDQWITLMQIVKYDGTANPVVEFYLNGVKQAELIATKSLKNSNGAYYPGQLWISGGPKTGSKDLPAYNFYVDDVKQYMLRDYFTVSAGKDYYTNFNQVTDRVTLNLTSQVSATVLENAITVKKGGVVADDVVVSVEKTDDYTAEISFGGMVADGSTYDVAISQVTDIYGNTSSETETFSVTTLIAGKLGITTDVTSVDYAIGTHDYIKVIANEKADVSGAEFYIKDENDETVCELTPTANAESTEFTFDLYAAHLPEVTASYTFVSAGTISNEDGSLVSNDIISIPVNAINYNHEGAYLVNEGFDGSNITKETNWITTSGAIPSGWGFQWRTASGTNGTAQSGYSVMVTKDPVAANEGNYVLKYQAPANGDGTHSATVFKTLTDSTMDTKIDPSKRVVLSSKVYLDENMKNNILKKNRFGTLPTLGTRDTLRDSYFLRDGISTDAEGNLVLTAQSYYTADVFKTTLETGEWFELKYVVIPTTRKDVSADGKNVTYDQWTYMVYINGVLVSVDVNGTDTTEFKGCPDYATVNGVKYNNGFTSYGNTGYNIYNIIFGIYPQNNGAATPTFYVDDIRLYQPDQLTATATASGSVITASYNNVLAKDSIDDIVITDAEGNTVAGAISNRKLNADGKTVVLTLNGDAVTPSTTYYVAGARDTINQSQLTGAAFAITESSSLAIASATASVVGGKVSAAVSVANSTGEDLPAFIAVAVYGADDEMLGIKFVNTTVTASGYNGTLEVDIQNRSGEIEEARAFLWDSAAGMVPYQNAVDVTVQ